MTHRYTHEWRLDTQTGEERCVCGVLRRLDRLNDDMLCRVAVDVACDLQNPESPANVRLNRRLAKMFGMFSIVSVG